jgi:glutathione synthase/RimK-type ligase-like ATP-grasp enzyme
MSIGIYATSDDTHALAMAARLEKRGTRTVFLANDRFPSEIRLSMGDGDYAVGPESAAGLPVWYVRAIATALPIMPVGDGSYQALADAKAVYVVEKEKQAFVAAWLKGLDLEGKAIVNGLGPMDQHLAKPYQVELLRRAGIPVPRTLVTNDPERLVAWAAGYPEAIYKPVAGGAHTRRLEPADLEDDRLALLAGAPVIFQERIVGDNIRVYVVGDRLVSAGVIHTAHVDFRQGVDHLEKVRLPAAVEEMCVKAVSVCGLHYSGVDVMHDKGRDRYVMLECNPCPMYQVWDDQIGDDVEGAIADYLIRHAN